MSEWSPEDVQKVVVALSAQAQLKAQRAADAKDAAQIEAGKALIANAEKCAACHHFHEAGELGAVPDLTDYGSREWLMGMISNPAHERFYRDANDRMPAFAEVAIGVAGDSRLFQGNRFDRDVEQGHQGLELA